MKKTGRTPVPVFSGTHTPSSRIPKPLPQVVNKPIHIVPDQVPTDEPSPKTLIDTVYKNARNRKYRTWTIRLFFCLVIITGIIMLITYVFDQTQITVEPVLYHHTGSDNAFGTIYPTARSLQYFIVTEQYTEPDTDIDTGAIYQVLQKQLPKGSFSSPELVVISPRTTETLGEGKIVTHYQASLIFFKQADINEYITKYIFQTKFPLIFSDLDNVRITLQNPVFINATTPITTVPIVISGDFSAVAYINPDTVRDLIVGINRSMCRVVLERNETIGINRALCHVFPFWRLRTSDGEHKITMKLYTPN